MYPPFCTKSSTEFICADDAAEFPDSGAVCPRIAYVILKIVVFTVLLQLYSLCSNVRSIAQKKFYRLGLMSLPIVFSLLLANCAQRVS